MRMSPLRLFVIRIGWQFTNTILMLVGLVVFLILAGTPFMSQLIADAGHWGVPGAFLTGFFFVSTFTVAPATLVLVSLTHILDPLSLAIAASAGAILGDYLIFRFVRTRLVDEWAPIFNKVADTRVGRLFASPFFLWLMPVLGASIIISPLPDEFGVGMLGASRLESKKMLALISVLNTIGVFLVVYIAHTFFHA